MNYPFLEIGAWDLIDPSRKKAYSQMRVVDGDALEGTGVTHFDAPSATGSDAIAWIVENDLLKSTLLKTFGPSVHVFDKALVESISLSSSKSEGLDWPIIKTFCGKSIQARLLVSLTFPHVNMCTLIYLLCCT